MKKKLAYFRTFKNLFDKVLKPCLYKDWKNPTIIVDIMNEKE